MSLKRNLHKIRIEINRFLLFKMRMCFPPWCFLFSRPCKAGIWFFWKGDEVLWKWPWYCKNRKHKLVSLELSGTGEFGDACYSSLKELDNAWNEYFDACANTKEPEGEEEWNQ
ncbi:MAG: hypothetical protein AABY22_21625 [Nanoarchaeota archaeon]